MAEFGGQTPPGAHDEPSTRRLRVRSVREVDIKQTRFAWRDYRPVGEVALLVGKPGIGKSAIVVDLAAKLTTGQLNHNSIVRSQLEKLRLLAQQTGTTILGIGHFRKATAGVDPVDAIGGAGAYRQVVRHALGAPRRTTTTTSCRSSSRTWCRCRPSRRCPTGASPPPSWPTTEGSPRSFGSSGRGTRRPRSLTSSSAPLTTTGRAGGRCRMAHRLPDRARR
ncbi:AAA family ATPase [Saccharothrix isguenensis]